MSHRSLCGMGRDGCCRRSDPVIHFAHGNQNTKCRGGDKLCVVATTNPDGFLAFPTRLPGGVARLDPHQRERCPRLDSPGKAPVGGIA